ncbi:MAG: hypothetical protein C0432_00175 [Candidatus Puniceispirillum sp.]|nr:hypothetical protein [Candidatus Pelagibacter sp.]MBA4282699.1 hypothetical protein [Candidatus Puniceispirillum sp.]
MRVFYLFSLLFICSSCDHQVKTTSELEVPPPAMHVHTVYPGAHPPIYSNVGMIESSYTSDFNIDAYTQEEKVLFRDN